MVTEVFLFGDFVSLPAAVGPYTLLDRIGSGGMAEVFLAELRGPQGFTKKLVLKRLLPEHAGAEDLEKLFLREAKVAALLDHPGLMQTYELVDVDGELFMVLEHVAGLDLSRLARAARGALTRIPFDVLAGALADVALGLHHMHTLRDADGGALTVVHRDVSPDNIVLAYTGAAKLIDFGIAKSVRAEQLTTVGEIKGKLRFMPPEQLKGAPLGTPADMWSFGVTLYRLLTTKHPFDGPGQLDVVEKILTRDPRPPRALDPRIPPDLDGLALALLEKNAADRPTADEVYGALVERWPRDLRTSAEFVARMMLPSNAIITAEDTTRDIDDASEVPTTDRGHVESAYREILGLRDDALVAVAPEGTRVVSVGARSDVHDHATRVVAEAQTRTAQAPRRATTPRVQARATSELPTAPLAPIQRSRSTAIVIAAAIVAGLAVAAFVVANASDAAPVERVARVEERAPPLEARAPLEAPALPPVEEPAPRPVDAAPEPAVEPLVEERPTRRGSDAKPRVVRVELRAPAGVAWRGPNGVALGSGPMLATLPADAREVTALDQSTGGRVRVPIVAGVADFKRVEKGTLHVLVFPFGKVAIGPRALGESPVAPVKLPVGHYEVRVTGEGKETTRDVDVVPGLQTVKVRLE